MKHVFILLTSFIFISNVYADEVWQPVSGIKESDMKEIVVGQGVIYAASEKKLYRSEDNGEIWRVVFSARGDGNVINFVSASKQVVFVCTDKGLFKGPTGRTYNRVFKGVGSKENSVIHIAFGEDGSIYLGTRGGLFVSDDNTKTWQKDPGEAGSSSVKWVSLLGGDLFVATEVGVYKGRDGNWERVFVTGAEETGYDSNETDSAVSAVKPVNSILVDKGKIYLATDSGIFISEDNGKTWGEFPPTNLLSKKPRRLLVKDSLYAATDKGVFVFDEKKKNWKALYKGMDADKAESMAVDNEGVVWVATNKGLYKSEERLLRFARNDKGEEDMLEFFNHEPIIREVQEVAIKYAEVHPEKINKWRQAAKQKALLPNLSVGVDRYVTDYYHWDAGQNPDVLQKGDDVVSWDVTMTWNLGELIWNDDQTSIDTRSRLMVQLRDDILDEITRTYFERRRLQIETRLSPPSDVKQKLEKDLRIQELTADLDALTGGYFSQQITR